MVLDIEKIAQIAHEVNRAYCSVIGDDSQLKWEDAPEWQRTSAENGVEFTVDRINKGLPLIPSLAHTEWMNDKLADGWKYGPVKDAEKKEHPCLVQYSELPIEQRLKDHLFGAVVRACCDALTE